MIMGQSGLYLAKTTHDHDRRQRGHGSDRTDTRGNLGRAAAMAAERERLTGQGVLPPLAVAAFRRGELRLEAELRWHEAFGRQLAAGVAGMAGRPQITSVR
jgi:hypothetical protein